MSRPVSTFPSRDEGLRLHQRLCQPDALAPAAICQAFVPGLVAYLDGWFAGVDEHLRLEAVHLAILDYLKAPERFRPEKGDLVAYLCRAARCDLCNLLRREARHCRHHISIFSVDSDEEGGNLIGREQEPLAQLTGDEDAAVLQELLGAVEAECDDDERIVLNLMRAGEADLVSCALALGISDLHQVKCIQDRLKKRIQRRRSA
jgi:hypothetical protein